MSTTIYWPDPTLPTEIHCGSGLLTGLEMAAVDGLLAIPRIGLGVGGLLLGRRENRRIYILEQVEITCSHSTGPTFALTAQEIDEGRKLAAEAAKNPERSVVGWYCSRTTGPMVLTDDQLSLFDSICPEAWQVALLMKPERGGPTTAAFGFRHSDEGGGSILWGAAREIARQELAEHQCPVPHQAVPPTSPSVPPPTPNTGFTEASGTNSQFRVPEVEPESEGHGRLLIRILAAIAVLAMLGATSFLTRGIWMRAPQLSMIGSSDWSGRSAVLWNGEAMSGLEHGSLVIDDGSGPLHTIHLNQSQLRAGVFQYDCRPGTVEATMIAGDLADSTTFIAPAPAHLPASGISK